MPVINKLQTTVFQSGNSQAVRIPKSLAFEGDVRKVLISKEKGRIVIELVSDSDDEKPRTLFDAMKLMKIEDPKVIEAFRSSSEFIDIRDDFAGNGDA